MRRTRQHLAACLALATLALAAHSWRGRAEHPTLSEDALALVRGGNLDFKAGTTLYNCSDATTRPAGYISQNACSDLKFPAPNLHCVDCLGDSSGWTVDPNGSSKLQFDENVDCSTFVRYLGDCKPGLGGWGYCDTSDASSGNCTGSFYKYDLQPAQPGSPSP